MLNSFNATGRVATKNVNQTATGVQYVKFVLAISRGINSYRKSTNSKLTTYI